MIGFRLGMVALLMALAIGSSAAVYWDLAVQPQMASHQALRQLEIHTDGSGDRAAAQRRLLSHWQHVPSHAVTAVAALVAVILIALDRPKPRVAEVQTGQFPEDGERK